MESFYLMYKNETIIFSEQNLVDCTDINDCTGGFPGNLDLIC